MVKSAAVKRAGRNARLTLVFALLAVCAIASSAEAAQRYADPAGSGTICSAGAPCPLETALGGSGYGDEIIVAPGNYGSVATPLLDLGAGQENRSIHGVAGQPRPTVYARSGGSSTALAAAYGNVSDLNIVVVPGGTT